MPRGGASGLWLPGYRFMASIPFPSPNDVIIEDDDPRVIYSSTGSWTVANDGSLSDVGLTYHFTPGDARGAWVSTTFDGTYIWYIADKKFNHGNNAVSIDDGPETTFSSYDPGLVLGQVLFHQEVTPGRHEINVTVLDGTVMGIDRFVYRPLDFLDSADPGSSTTPTALGPATQSTATTQHLPSSEAQSQTSSRTDTRKLPAGAYVGIGLGSGAVLLLLLATGILLRFRTRRRERGPSHTHIESIVQHDSHAPMPITVYTQPPAYREAAAERSVVQDKSFWYRQK